MFSSGRRLSAAEVATMQPEDLARICTEQIATIDKQLDEFGRSDGEVFLTITAEARVPFYPEGQS
jgi:hypothetical protein